MKNKRIADLSVISLTLLIIIITIIKINFGSSQWFEMLSFVAEAALVGAIADWFAITALFEKPFLVGKLPIIASHTAIITKNRESIVSAVAYMVENELLSKKVLRSKIEQINMIDGLINFVDKNISTRSDLYEELIEYFIEKINSVDTIELAGFLENYLKQKIEGTDISDYLNKSISYGIQSEEFKKIFNLILDSIVEYVNRGATKNTLEKFTNDLVKKEANSLVMERIIGILKSVNAINASDLTISILEQINKTLFNLKDERNLLRYEIIEKVRLLFDKIYTKNEVKSDIEKWKIEMLTKVSIQDDLNSIIKEVIEVITKKEVYLCNNSLEQRNEFEGDMFFKKDITSVVTSIKAQLEKSWNELKNDYVNKKIIDEFIKESIFKFIEAKYKNVGLLVKQVLNNMDDESLNNFIKKKAGNELHGIRLNGCIIGALFGGVVFGITHLIYDLILPNIFNLKF